MNHTATPWTHEGHGLITGIENDPENGRIGPTTVAIVCIREVPDWNEGNARRIVACVNACEGSSTEWLEFQTSEDMAEQFGLPEPFETRDINILKKGLEYMKQRDALLDVLQGLNGRLLRCCATGATASEAYDSFYQDEVNSAITEATGGAV